MGSGALGGFLMCQGPGWFLNASSSTALYMYYGPYVQYQVFFSSCVICFCRMTDFGFIGRV